MGEEYDFFVSEIQIADWLFVKLIELGYVPSSDEIFDIAEIMFEFIMNLFTQSGVDTIVEFKEDED